MTATPSTSPRSPKRRWTCPSSSASRAGWGSTWSGRWSIPSSTNTGKSSGRRGSPSGRRELDMFTIENGPDGAVVMTGRLDSVHASTAQSFLDRLKGTVTLDCRRLEYISSAGLGALLKTQKQLMVSGGKLRLTGVNRHLRDIFRYSGFDQ